MLTIISWISPTPLRRSGFQMRRVEPPAQRGAQEQRHADRQPERQREVDPEREHHERAERDQLGVGEVREARGSEDQREADRREREQQPEVQAVDDRGCTNWSKKLTVVRAPSPRKKFTDLRSW